MDETKKRNIYESLNGVMRDIGAVAKNDKNTFDGYKFRGIDAVMNALAPALKNNGVIIVPEVVEQVREERVSDKGKAMTYSILTVKYTFYAEDGSSVTAVTVGEGMDRGDKASNKAMSAAYKYAAFQVLCIPTEEMHDSEEESPEVKARKEEPLTDKEFQIISALLEETGADINGFLKFFKADKVASITRGNFSQAVQMLEKKKGAKK